MATTRRPQINHRLCDHAATPKARKACRKAQRAAEAQVVATPEPNCFQALSGNTHQLAYLADGTPVPACAKRPTKGQAIHLTHSPVCNRCNGVGVENRGRAR